MRQHPPRSQCLSARTAFYINLNYRKRSQNGLKGQKKSAQGSALGRDIERKKKGTQRNAFAPVGRWLRMTHIPRALPWADSFCPFRASLLRAFITLSYTNLIDFDCVELTHITRTIVLALTDSHFELDIIRGMIVKRIPLNFLGHIVVGFTHEAVKALPVAASRKEPESTNRSR